MTSVEQLRAQLARRGRERLAEDEQAAARAREVLPQLVALLMERGATEIFLFGSLAEGRFRSSSDIDLATRGLAWRRSLGSMVECTTLAGRSVDIVTLEDAPPSLVERIATDGERLV